MKYSLGISNFLEEISSLSHSVVFLYFFALMAEEAFLICSRYSLELCIQRGIPFLLSFAFHFSASLLFTAVCKVSPDSHFAVLHFYSMGMVLIPVSCTMSWTSVHSSSGTLSIRSSPLNLFVSNIKHGNSMFNILRNYKTVFQGTIIFLKMHCLKETKTKILLQSFILNKLANQYILNC